MENRRDVPIDRAMQSLNRHARRRAESAARDKAKPVTNADALKADLNRLLDAAKTILPGFGIILHLVDETARPAPGAPPVTHYAATVNQFTAYRVLKGTVEAMRRQAPQMDAEGESNGEG